MRKSLQDIKHMVSHRPYPGQLPEKLKSYHYYISDSGHVIMCVLKAHLAKAQKSGMDEYEIPVPAKYVLEKGYQFVDGYVIVDAEYNRTFGLEVNEKYFEY